jgi:hypothetical protein
MAKAMDMDTASKLETRIQNDGSPWKVVGSTKSRRGWRLDVQGPKGRVKTISSPKAYQALLEAK